MGGGSGQIPETAAQKALAANAAQRMADYQARWLPVQRSLAAQIEAEGSRASPLRAEAVGKAATDSAISFGQAQGALEKSFDNHGVAPGSGRFDMGITGLGLDAAKSSGLSQVVSDQQIDDAYTKGLGALVAIGQGQSAEVGQGLTEQAQASALQARADAQAALEDKMAIGGAVGTAIGAGVQQWAPAPPVGMGSNPNGYNGTQNNPSAYVGSASAVLPETIYTGSGL